MQKDKIKIICLIGQLGNGGTERQLYLFLKHLDHVKFKPMVVVSSKSGGSRWEKQIREELSVPVKFLGDLPKAAKLAKLDSYRILNLPKQKDPFTQIMSKFSGDLDDVLLKSQLGDNYHYFEMIQNMSNVKGVQARLPYDIKIN